MKLIDKDALLAEIKRAAKCEETWMEKQGYTEYHQGLRDAYKRILSLIYTLEVKDVDLDKILTGFMGKYAYENSGEYPSAIDIAKHFFELGLKAQKEE